MTIKAGVLLSLLAAAASGCAGAKARMEATSDLLGPASFTEGIYDSRGNVLSTGEGLEVVGKIDAEKTSWSVLYTLIPLGGTWDVSPILNEGMRTAKGDAVVNLEVSATSNSLINYMATLVPVLPCYTTVRLQGDVVRVVQQ